MGSDAISALPALATTLTTSGKDLSAFSTAAEVFTVSVTETEGKRND
jgi:hypothetical protein